MSFGSQSLTYNANGNLSSDGTYNYTWDARNRLSSMTGASFVYDPLGRRVSKTISGASTSYLYDGQNPVQEGSANLLTGLGIDEYLTRTDSAGSRSFLTDALGSSVALADNSGAVQTQYTYEPFGKTTATGQTTSNPFQYTGRENDGTGLYYYRARYYSPTLQRFISEDPLYSPLYNVSKCLDDYAPNVSRYIEKDRNLGRLLALRFYFVVSSLAPNPQLLHLYTYTEDNPINKRDPLGLISDPQAGGCDVVGGGGGFFDSPCAVKCCNKHDDCYKEATVWCDKTSWWRHDPYFFEPATECDACNGAALVCLAKAARTDGRKPCS